MKRKPQTFEYTVDLSLEADGQHLGNCPVPDAFLETAREQIMFDGQRQGVLGPQLGDVQVADRPIYPKESETAGEGQGNGHAKRIRGVAMTVGEKPRQVEKIFGIRLFEPFVNSVTRNLVETQQVDADDLVNYHVFAQPAPPADDSEVNVRVSRNPLPVSEGNLDDWLAVGQPDGPLNDMDYPLFVLEDEVLKAAEKLCWQGKEAEGGCWPVGNLYQQIKPKPEIFGVLHTVFRAEGCKHDRFGLEPSAETYVKLQEQLQRRQRRANRVGELAMGFCHSHPFSPSELLGHDACSACTSHGPSRRFWLACGWRWKRTRRSPFCSSTVNRFLSGTRIGSMFPISRTKLSLWPVNSSIATTAKGSTSATTRNS